MRNWIPLSNLNVTARWTNCRQGISSLILKRVFEFSFSVALASCVKLQIDKTIKTKYFICEFKHHKFIRVLGLLYTKKFLCQLSWQHESVFHIHQTMISSASFFSSFYVFIHQTIFLYEKLKDCKKQALSAYTNRNKSKKKKLAEDEDWKVISSLVNLRKS